MIVVEHWRPYYFPPGEIRLRWDRLTHVGKAALWVWWVGG